MYHHGLLLQQELNGFIGHLIYFFNSSLSLSLSSSLYTHTYIYIYIYIHAELYMCVCVCVCVFRKEGRSRVSFDLYISTYNPKKSCHCAIKSCINFYTFSKKKGTKFSFSFLLIKWYTPIIKIHRFVEFVVVLLNSGNIFKKKAGNSLVLLKT